MAKKHIEILYFSKNAKPGGSRGVWQKDQTLSGFCFEHPSRRKIVRETILYKKSDFMKNFHKW